LSSRWTDILFGRKVKIAMFPIAPLENDDSEFLELASHIAGQVIQQFRPVDVFLIRTDHWFGTKWLGFSGKMLGALGVTKCRLTLP
jgi:hypothetical protein